MGPELAVGGTWGQVLAPVRLSSVSDAGWRDQLSSLELDCSSMALQIIQCTHVFIHTYTHTHTHTVDTACGINAPVCLYVAKSLSTLYVIMIESHF